MIRNTILVIAAGLILGSLALAQNPAEKKPQAPAAQPAHELAAAMAQRLSNELHVKTVVGDPVKVGALTLIPIMALELGFGGGGAPAPGPDGFFMHGDARPLGFVAIGKKGTRFISVARTTTPK